MLKHKKVKIPNIETGLIMPEFEKILGDYVRVRAQEYYKWKDYQNSIQYAGLISQIHFFLNIR